MAAAEGLKIPAAEAEAAGGVPNATEVYILLGGRVRVSRNDRAKWFLDHLGKEVTADAAPPADTNVDDEKALTVVSVLNAEGDGVRGAALVTGQTQVRFLPRRFRLAFVLDFGSSAAHCPSDAAEASAFGRATNMMTALKACLTGLSKPFHPPGRPDFLLKPRIHLTVMAAGHYVEENAQVRFEC